MEAYFRLNQQELDRLCLTIRVSPGTLRPLKQSEVTLIRVLRVTFLNVALGKLACYNSFRINLIFIRSRKCFVAKSAQAT